MLKGRCPWESRDKSGLLATFRIKGFEDFSEGVSRSLDKTLGKLDVEMAKASNLLASSVEQLGESVSELDDVLSRVRA